MNHKHEEYPTHQIHTSDPKGKLGNEILTNNVVSLEPLVLDIQNTQSYCNHNSGMEKLGNKTLRGTAQ